MGKDGESFDLTKSEIDICLKMSAQIMDPFRTIESRWIRVPITQELIAQIQALGDSTAR